MAFQRVEAICCLAMLILVVASNETQGNESNLRFPTVGVVFLLPEGIDSSLDGRPGTLALLTPKGEQVGTSSFLIALEFTPCNGRDLRAYANGIAAKMQGKISETTLGGVVAIEINVVTTVEKRSPSRVKIVEKDDCFFIMLLHSTSKNEGMEDFDKVCSGARWTKREPPSKHLDLEEPREILSGALRLRLPRIFRIYPTADTRKEVAFGASNYVDKHEEFFLQARIFADSGENSLVQLAGDFEETIATAFRLKEGLSWTLKKSDRKVISSNVFDAEIQVPGGPKMIHKMLYCLVRLPSKQVVLLQFGIADATEEAIDAYTKCIDEILDSIEAVEKR